MKISSTGTDPRSDEISGFTLIELLVAMAIILIVTGVALISVAAGLGDAKMRSGCRMTASVLNYARSHAVSTGNNTRVVFDNGRLIEVEENTNTPSTTLSTTASEGDNGYTMLSTSAGKPQALPDGIGVTRLVKRSGTTDDNWIEFDKFGQAEPAVVELTDSDMKKRYVVVDPITGRCRIEMNVDEIIEGW